MSGAPASLITGVESFVGARLVMHCKDKGISYVGVDVMASEDPDVSGVDICDDALSELIPIDSVVIHLAAILRD